MMVRLVLGNGTERSAISIFGGAARRYTYNDAGHIQIQRFNKEKMSPLKPVPVGIVTGASSGIGYGLQDTAEDGFTS